MSGVVLEALAKKRTFLLVNHLNTPNLREELFAKSSKIYFKKMMLIFHIDKNSDKVVMKIVKVICC